MAKDVLEVLAAAANGYCEPLPMLDAHDRIAELIAADVERAAAEGNYITCDIALRESILSDTHKSPERAKARRDKNDAVLRRNAAVARQESALAACRGL